MPVAEKADQASGSKDELADRPNSMELAMGHWQLARDSFHELSQRRFRKVENVVHFIQKRDGAVFSATSINEYERSLAESIRKNPDDHKRIALLGVISNYIDASQYSSAIFATIPRPSSHYSYYEDCQLRDGLVPALYAADLVASATGLILDEGENPFAGLAGIEIRPTP